MGYGSLREALSRELREASGHRIERAIGTELAEDLEDLSGVLKTVGSYAVKAAPGAIQGAATGFLAGGPMGAVAGAALGGVSSSGVLGGPRPSAPASGPMPTGVANPAALQLLLTVLRPEIVDALMALALGQNGSRSVPLAGTLVPVAAVTNLIQSLAEHASAVHHAARPVSGVPRYLSEAMRRGHDISASAVRAEALLSLVHDAWDDDLADAEDEDFDEDYDDE